MGLAPLHYAPGYPALSSFKQNFLSLVRFLRKIAHSLQKSD